MLHSILVDGFFSIEINVRWFACSRSNFFVVAAALVCMRNVCRVDVCSAFLFRCSRKSGDPFSSTS